MTFVQLIAAVVALAAIAFAVMRGRAGRRRAAMGGAVVAVAAIGLALLSGGLPSADELADDIAGRLGNWIYPLVAVMAFAETAAFVGLIAPGETALIVGGLCAQRGEADLGLLVLAAWAASLTGDYVGFTLGRRLGTGWLQRHGPRVGATAERVDKVHAFTARHGRPALFVGRFVGFIRPLVPFVAGTAGMPLRTFMAVSVLSTGVWASAYVVLGYLAADSLEQDGAILSGVLAALALFAVAVVLLRRRARLREPRAVR